MSATQFPSLFDMTALEPHGAEGGNKPIEQFREPLVGELVFDKFAQSQARNDSFSGLPAVKKEFESPLLDLTPQLDDSANAASDFDQFFASSADSTPLFELENVESDPQNWNSLFDDDISVSISDSTQAQPSDAQKSRMSLPERVSDTLEESPYEHSMQASTFIDQKSFLPTPVIEDAKLTHSIKKYSAAGSVQKPVSLDRMGFVPYNRKSRAAPLTPIIPESDDPVAMKRAKNTEAARRSRARKFQRMTQLEVKVEELLKKNTELEREVATLRSLLGSQN
ncbi:LANO_0H19174g1_1 [Lachancea nothofagi CBS 11611]|uniref:LANO_0H19174g1_1 n=1 Tax=Lachancea nothofagi CBS 11611 TaxID=1266666 RepID=A0A1G4KNB9_9SACH|nr:LANO_0H19174g1_1 [Lachancea nothofagi CBS 11611]